MGALVILIADTNTDQDNVTDAGLKAFSAALGSSSTITTVALKCKYERLVRWYPWVSVLMCMRVCVCVWSVCILNVDEEWMLAVGHSIMFLGRVCVRVLNGWV